MALDANDVLRSGGAGALRNKFDSALASTTDEEDATEVAAKAWPIMQSGAAYGVIGEMGRLATEHSEADPIAVMGTALVFAATAFGRDRYVLVGDTVHHPRLFMALVGASSRARKGTSTAPVRRFFDAAERAMLGTGTLPYGAPMKVSEGPLSSGEGLIDAIRDKTSDEDEGGVVDKRIICLEGEFGSVLRSFQRQGNTLSNIMRVTWDGGTVAPLTKSNKIRATNPHVCLVGHITQQELNAELSSTDVWNGFANRIAWLAVRRQKLVPFPRPMSDENVDRIGKELARVIAYNHDRKGERLVMTNAAQSYWVDLYAELTQEHSGILGVVTSRAEAQALRLATTFALLDGADRIERWHVDAAITFWRYSFDSAAYIFGGVEIDPIAQKILDALSTGSKTQTELWNFLGRHTDRAKLMSVLADLQDRGRATLEQEPTAGRPRNVWRLTS